MKFDYKTLAKIKLASKAMRDGFTMNDMVDFLLSHGIEFRGGINSSKGWAAEESLKGIRSKTKLNKVFGAILENQDWSYKKPTKLLERLARLEGRKLSAKRRKFATSLTIDTLHPVVKKASKKLYEDGHFAQAVFEACKALNNEVKRISGLEDLDGVSLMHTAFSPKNPKIRLTEMRTKTDKDEQQGFMDLFAGAMGGLRNPRGHEEVLDSDPTRVLETLALMSLLMKKLDERILH